MAENYRTSSSIVRRLAHGGRNPSRQKINVVCPFDNGLFHATVVTALPLIDP
jgi:hypothetical protein